MKKFKKHKKSIIITSIVTIFPILIGILLWDKLPEEIATHFGSNGEANDWSSKAFAVIGLPCLMLLVHFLCIAATCTDPKNKKISDKIFKLLLWIAPIISWFCSLSMYAYELGWNINITSWSTIFVGCIFIVIGNFLPKCRQSYTVGIKIPWTLNSEANWYHTHRLAGKLWMIGGILFVACTVLNLLPDIVLPIIAGVMVLVPIVFSYLYYLKNERDL